VRVGRDLCYDRIRPHRVQAAPQLHAGPPGLQAENISVKRDRIVFKYSF
jgi:hypothetical protein